MHRKYYVSAYATSPSFHKWDSKIEKNYFSYLSNKPEIVGIEHPFLVNSEKYSSAWLLDNIPSHWNLIITALPALMQAAKLNSYFGIASVIEQERCKAMLLIEQINHYALNLNRLFGRKIVKAIHLHSSPQSCDGEIRGNKLAFKKSLNEISQMDWESTDLNIEHCDAYIPYQISEKGFLTLEDELEAMDGMEGYGIVLNWGRSAIEGRSSRAPIKHLHAAIDKRRLKGFVFSGCTNKIENSYGFWKDTHMPPKNFINGRYLDNNSLLGATEIMDVMELLDDHKLHIYFGIKVYDPINDGDFYKKVGLNIETIDAIESVCKQ